MILLPNAKFHFFELCQQQSEYRRRILAMIQLAFESPYLYICHITMSVQRSKYHRRVSYRISPPQPNVAKFYVNSAWKFFLQFSRLEII